jgi:hypothetical protein
MKPAWISLLLAALAAAPALAETKASGKAVAGDVAVSWVTMGGKVARSAGVARGQSLILFSFDPKAAGSSVGQAAWEAEAARHGVSVATLKQILGPSVYVTGDGRLASCTMGAIAKGLCGDHVALSVESRARIAEAVLDQSGKCRWTGFDPGLHSRLAQMNGAASATLWVAADCG